MSFVFFLLGVVGLVIYFIPTMVAFNRGVEARVIIFVLNLIFGWTFIVWLVLLIWASTARRYL